MAFNSGMKGKSRHFGLVGAGKGCQDRTTDRAAFNSNFDLIDWGLNIPWPGSKIVSLLKYRNRIKRVYR